MVASPPSFLPAPRLPPASSRLACRGLRYVKLSPLSRAAGGVQHSGELPQTQIRLRHPWGQRSVELSPLSRPAGGFSTVGNRRGFELDLAIPGGLQIVKLSPLSRPAKGTNVTAPRRGFKVDLAIHGGLRSVNPSPLSKPARRKRRGEGGREGGQQICPPPRIQIRLRHSGGVDGRGEGGGKGSDM